MKVYIICEYKDRELNTRTQEHIIPQCVMNETTEEEQNNITTYLATSANQKMVSTRYLMTIIILLNIALIQVLILFVNCNCNCSFYYFAIV